MDSIKNLRIPQDIERVPRHKGGIYSFSLRFPTDYELGLKSKVLDCQRVALNIRNRIEDLDRLQNRNEFSGSISSNGAQSSHISRMYEVSFIEGKVAAQMDLLESITSTSKTPEELLILSNALRQAFSYASPIYVGMTQKQSLRTRLGQHLSNDSQFSQRLKQHKLSWQDLEYSFISLDDFYVDMSSELEKLIQSIFKPSLSMR